MLVSLNWLLVSVVLIILGLISINLHFKFFAFHPFTEYKEGDIKVLSLNVHSTGDRFEERSQQIIKLIKRENPDFVFLTEYHDSCSQTLDSLLIEKYPYHQRGIYGAAYLSECIYSKYDIDTISALHVDKESEIYKGYIEEAPTMADHLNYISILKCQLKKDKKYLAIYCCHLSSNNYFEEISSNNSLPIGLNTIVKRLKAYNYGCKLREIEVNALCDSIKNENTPTIVLGDMNDLSGFMTMKRIESMSFEDAWWNAGFGCGFSFNSNWLNLRIDHILYNNKLILNGIKLDSKDLSDHKAIIASFTF